MLCRPRVKVLIYGLNYQFVLFSFIPIPFCFHLVFLTTLYQCTLILWFFYLNINVLALYLMIRLLQKYAGNIKKVSCNLKGQTYTYIWAFISTDWVFLLIIKFWQSLSSIYFTDCYIRTFDYSIFLHLMWCCGPRKFIQTCKTLLDASLIACIKQKTNQESYKSL